MLVTDVRATKIKNSRGEPTIQISVNNVGYGSAPSGTSKGKHEAVAYPKGIDYAVKFVNSKLRKSLLKFKFNRFEDLKNIEAKLPKDFGANPTIALEFALLNALATNKDKPLWQILNSKARKMPRILANVVGGGAHAPKFKTSDIQEILLSPNTRKIENDVRATLEFHSELRNLLRAKKQDDEGAWISNLNLNDTFEILLEVTGYERGIDVAASQLYKNGKYYWKHLWGVADKKKQIEIIKSLADEYDLFYVEDPLQQEDFAGFAELRKKLPDVMICGDDLTATNLDRLKLAVKKKSINAIIIKPNQCGSLIKTKEVFDFAVKNGITPIVSHRAGETFDATIAHLAFAWQAPFVKFGIAQKQRMAKLNELIKIEKNL